MNSKKRHSALQPFSRDHHQGLVLVQTLLKKSNGDEHAKSEGLNVFLKAWHNDLEPHFNEEESVLLPVMDERYQQHMKRDHEFLRQKALEAKEAQTNPSMLADEWFRETATRLKDHIRWEEQDLFPALEASLSNEKLKELEKETTRYETEHNS